MHVLIVLAHPEKKSFNAHLAQQAQDTWRAQGHQATVLDLYAEQFEPREGDWHYSSRLDAGHFDTMQEQRHHWHQQALPRDVERHIELLLRADALILQFPFWWFGAPAILKGWMDRVFVYGGLYQSQRRHERGIMRGKKALVVSTAGASAQACAANGRDGDMRLLLWPILHSLHYIGFEVLEPYLFHGVRSGLAGEAQAQQRSALEQRTLDYRARLLGWEQWPAIPFNRQQDFTEELSLKPGAPSYSPFVRHLP
ncbi:MULTISPECIES: NAD(P)H-dependent oxidoreductase [Pseudomonas]|uniref:NAD(P)H dehydrogenase (Quinone) n=1 Tax=Pseudomonas chlororaphis TaxID=587753 RepID=A0A0D5XZE4_9PSED|nr:MULTISPECIES: NAD(P)H-dependent oxidoreductase [Pseudomonas]AJO79030.1 NADH-ubiquinone oxidoreductase [Pseudomonas sp. MRSN 12121]AKA24094.1 NAD(P)H dehydrogenase (quinone) [Pseudomonas chlororaphis]